jgi:Tol biopolymer transport system component
MLGLLFLLQTGGVAWSQVTERVSVDSAGAEGNNASTAASTSSGGRYVAFESFATNLVGVGNDNNNKPDVFVHDRQTGTTTRVSVGLAGAEGDDSSTDPSISSDGRYVAFESFATNLLGVGNDTNGFSDIFVHDRQTGTTTRVSVNYLDVTEGGNGPSFDPSISGDSRYVAFESDADNLVVADNGLYYDVFVHDLQTGTTTRVSVDSAGAAGIGNSFAPSISSDGRYVAFESAADNLLGVGNDNNGVLDVFVHDRQTGATTRVSVDSAGAEGIGGDSSSCSISSDGRYVAFVSDATNLLGVGNDTNGRTDVFVHDRQTGATTRVSVDSAGAEGNNNSNFPSISSDGRYVAFESDATNLVGMGNDTNLSTDVFVHDRDTDGDGLYDEPGEVSTTRVSKDLDGVQGNGNSNAPSISGDGGSVTFQSVADNLVAGDTLGFPDIFADDLQAGAGGNEGDGDGNSSGGCFIATAATSLVW